MARFEPGTLVIMTVDRWDYSFETFLKRGTIGLVVRHSPPYDGKRNYVASNFTEEDGNILKRNTYEVLFGNKLSLVHVTWLCNLHYK